MSKIKLHLGCGTVYLDGYVNIDMEGVPAKLHPERKEHNLTTIDKYYKYPFRKNMYNKVYDIKDDVTKLNGFEENSVDEILSVNLIDHMKKDEFLDMLMVWKKVLKPGGVLIIDVDDRRKQAQILVEADTVEKIEWAMRLIYCHHRTKYDTHYWGYTPEYLKSILEDNGFNYVWTKTDYIVHDVYPNFQIKATNEK